MPEGHDQVKDGWNKSQQLYNFENVITPYVAFAWLDIQDARIHSLMYIMFNWIVSWRS